MYTKDKFRKMVIDSECSINNLILVSFYDKRGVFIYKVSDFQEVDEEIYNTDEFYNCEIDEVIYASSDNHCKVNGCYDFSINDIEEIKNSETGEILYRKNHLLVK